MSTNNGSDNNKSEKVVLAIVLIIIAAIIIYIIYTIFMTNENLNNNTTRNDDKLDIYKDDTTNPSNENNIYTTSTVEEEIASYTTTIYDKDENRVHNISLANSKLNNHIIKPNEEFSFNNTIALSSIVFTSSALGDVPTVHVIGIPSKQSMIGDKYTFSSPILNSVMSVNHFLFGLSAWKSLCTSFGTAGEISPK